MALLNPYCTIDELKHELKLPVADVSKDSELEEAINNASRWIDDRMGRDFFYHDYSSTPLVLDEFDAVYDGEIFPKFRPIIEITALSQAGVAYVDGTDYVWKAADAHKPDRIIRLGGGLWAPSRPDHLISINGKFGYVQASSAAIPTGLPGRIAHAARLVAAAFSGHNRKEIVGLDGQRTEVFTKDIPKLVLDMLGARVPLLV